MIHAGHFVLTEALLQKMEETARETGRQGRIINISSMIHKWVKEGFHLHDILKPKVYDDLQFIRKFYVLVTKMFSLIILFDVWR
jgi:hypothetical protein